MLKLEEVCGWVMITGGAGYASSSLTKLASVRRGWTRIHAIPVQVWSSLLLGLMILADGVSSLYGFRLALVIWIAVALLIAYLIVLSVPGAVSRKKATLPWWRFWIRVTPPPDPVGTGGSELDADTAVFLIQRIKNTRFSTTRFSPGYDEREVNTFLNNLITVLGEYGRLDPAELHNVQFSTTRIRLGYAIRDVDNFLDDIEATLPQSR
jgi:DivIVA domain-containing protein